MDRNFRKPARDEADASPPSESWLFAQALLGKPIPNPASAQADARAKREHLEWLASFSTEHAAQLRRLQSEEAEARHQRELLQWLATFSTEHERELRRLQAREAEAIDAQASWERFYEDYSASLAEWAEVDHPRSPKGTPDGGQWVAMAGGSGGVTGGSAQVSKTGAEPTEQSKIPATKSQLPADRRGTWVSGTKGHGAFRYNDSIENREAGLVGKEIRFENQHIAVGGFPPEAYYRGNAGSAKVEVDSVTGFRSDSAAADAKMREKLQDPAWKRPQGYLWNHAGGPGSKAMELVDIKYHRSVAHKGPGAIPRALDRLAGGHGGSGRAMAALTVYLVARDTLQAAGVLGPDYEVLERESYQFAAEDGSVFFVRPAGIFTNAKREFVDGPRKEDTETITNAQADEYRSQAETEWGRYVPGTPLSGPRFIPGTKRRRIPFFIHEYGVPREAGWIDENGVHRYPTPKPAIT